MLKAVTLDFWATLVDDRHGAVPRRIDTLAEQLPDLALERVRSAYKAAWDDFLRAGRQGWGLPPAMVLSGTLGGLGVSLPPEAYAQVLRTWENSCIDRPPPLVPQTAETLRALRARGLRIGLISDTGVSPGQVLRQYLVRKGLRSLFDWLTFSNETGVTKYHPQAYLLTLRALGVEPHEALHVGDTPAPDIRGAHAVGMAAALTIQVRDKRRGDEAPDLVIERLADLPDALARWQAERQAT